MRNSPFFVITILLIATGAGCSTPSSTWPALQTPKPLSQTTTPTPAQPKRNESDVVRSYVKIIPPREDTRTFTGSWSGEADGIDFHVELEEDDAMIRGYHCGVTKNANRIDCCLETFGDDASVQGFVTNEGSIGEDAHSGRLDISSCYHDAQVGVFIELSEDGQEMNWTVIDDSIIEHYIPREVVLERE